MLERTALGGKITWVRFETPSEDVTIYSDAARPARSLAMLSAYGAVGRVQTLTSRGGLRFTLYDTLDDRAVSCYLEEGQEELMRGTWGQRARVEGWVSRDPLTGRPVTVRRVKRIEILREPQLGDYTRARGVLPLEPGGLSPEDAVRRVRDA